MRGWKMAKEPTLEELLGDEMMTAVMRSAGLDAKQLRALLAELARRLPAERLKRPCGCSAEREFQPVVA